MSDTITNKRAAIAYEVMRLPFRAEEGDASSTSRLQFSTATLAEINHLLAERHYLGPIKASSVCMAGWVDDVLVAAMAWRWPTARMLPTDGSWLELCRWCLTADAGRNAGSRMMGWAARWIRVRVPSVSTLVSYSDPVHGHTGSLYKASGWTYAPTHHSLRFHRDGIGYPSGHGSWDGKTKQSPKDRWLYQLRRAHAGTVDHD